MSETNKTTSVLSGDDLDQSFDPKDVLLDDTGESDEAVTTEEQESVSGTDGEEENFEASAAPIDPEGSPSNEADTDSSKEKEGEQKEGSDPDAGKSIISRFGSWAQENLPEWAYKAFWGTIRLIGKIARAILFGDEHSSDRIVHSFERAMAAEELKATRSERQSEAREAAASVAHEAAKEAEAAQHTQNNNPEKETHEDPHKIAMDIIQRRGFKIIDDQELEGNDILKISRAGKDGKEKEYYLDKAVLTERNSDVVHSALNEALAVCSAERFLQNHKLSIAAVGNEKFIVERPGGPAFAFDRSMMKDQLAEVVRIFKEKEKSGAESATITADMIVPLTSSAVKKITEQSQAAVQNPEANVLETPALDASNPSEEKQIEEEETGTPQDSQDAKAIQSPIAAPLVIEEEKPVIAFTSYPDPRQDIYRKLEAENYTVTKDYARDQVSITSSNGYSCRFNTGDLNKNIAENMSALSRAMEKMNVAPGSLYDPPHRLDDTVNYKMSDYFDRLNIVMVAEENGGDSVYVFKKTDEGVDQTKCWVMSQALLAAGDATDLSRIIFEVEHPKLMNLPETGSRTGIVSAELESATKAIAIVANMRHETIGLADRAPAAFADIITEKGSESVWGTSQYGDEDIDPTEIIIYFNGAETSVMIGDSADMLDEAASEMISQIDNTKDDCSIVSEYMKEPANEIDHSIGMAMLSAEEADYLSSPDLLSPEDMDYEELNPGDEYSFSNPPSYQYDEELGL